MKVENYVKSLKDDTFKAEISSQIHLVTAILKGLKPSEENYTTFGSPYKEVSQETDRVSETSFCSNVFK